ncbi:MAG: LAO/AO transport system kinase [Flavobacteriales bacterium]|jgi:LAO/AO transport system kinase
MARPSVDELRDGITTGKRAALARAITLIESTTSRDRTAARELLSSLPTHTSPSHRIGITGVPGVGKSTFIESFGLARVLEGHKVAVLAVDPTSERTHGSILGDKTRMSRLSMREEAFVRPTPSSGTLGGVASRTRETIALCEAAGYDLIIVETVGVGQSETLVSKLVDVFLVLMLPGAGDELQGIKRGIMELADVVAINKADGDRKRAAALARRQIANALHTLRPASPSWSPPALVCSALDGDGLAEVWEQLLRHRAALASTDEWQQRRAHQAVHWLGQLVDEGLRTLLGESPDVATLLRATEQQVSRGELPVGDGADNVMAALRASLRGS